MTDVMLYNWSVGFPRLRCAVV